jgi:hypothetical protein
MQKPDRREETFLGLYLLPPPGISAANPSLSAGSEEFFGGVGMSFSETTKIRLPVQYGHFYI